MFQTLISVPAENRSVKMNVIVNGVEEILNSPLTLSDLLKEKEINSKTVVIEHNKVIIRENEYPTTNLNEGDALEILRILGGG